MRSGIKFTTANVVSTASGSDRVGAVENNSLRATARMAAFRAHGQDPLGPRHRLRRVPGVRRNVP
jgi:hypothetical protein